jgi:glycosyltransferase involved in cell wall biosynthesis
VVVPAFNPGVRLRSALASIFAQEGLALEVIVVNDGSDQDFGQLLVGFRSSVRCVDQPHRGPAAARNRGVDLASEPIIGFLDADDAWPAGSLRRAFEAWERAQDASGVHGLTQLVVEDDTTSGGWLSVGAPWRSPQVGSILIRRDVAKTIRFDETLDRGEDLDWFARLRESGSAVASLDHVLLQYRLHGQNMTFGLSPDERNTFVVLKRALDRRRVRRRLD